MKKKKKIKSLNNELASLESYIGLWNLEDEFNLKSKDEKKKI